MSNNFGATRMKLNNLKNNFFPGEGLKSEMQNNVIDIELN